MHTAFKVMRVKIVTKHSVISPYLLAKTRGLRRIQFSPCYKLIMCLNCYYERSMCSPLASHAVTWRLATPVHAVLHKHDGMVWRHRQS